MILFSSQSIFVAFLVMLLMPPLALCAPPCDADGTDFCLKPARLSCESLAVHNIGLDSTDPLAKKWFIHKWLEGVPASPSLAPVSPPPTQNYFSKLMALIKKNCS